jgi:hypothetical protein
MTNQGKLLNTHLELFCLFINLYFFVKSLPWPFDIHGSISFYCDIFYIEILCVKMSRVNKALMQYFDHTQFYFLTRKAASKASNNSTSVLWEDTSPKSKAFSLK